MNEAEITAYLGESFKLLGIIWGAFVLGAFILYYVLCAATGAGESGSGEEEDES